MSASESTLVLRDPERSALKPPRPGTAARGPCPPRQPHAAAWCIVEQRTVRRFLRSASLKSSPTKSIRVCGQEERMRALRKQEASRGGGRAACSKPRKGRPPWAGRKRGGACCQGVAGMAAAGGRLRAAAGSCWEGVAAHRVVLLRVSLHQVANAPPDRRPLLLDLLPPRVGRRRWELPLLLALLRILTPSSRPGLAQRALGRPGKGQPRAVREGRAQAGSAPRRRQHGLPGRKGWHRHVARLVPGSLDEQ